MGKTTQVSFWIEGDLIKDFKKMCIDEGTSMSGKLEKLIKDFLNKEKKDDKHE